MKTIKDTFLLLSSFSLAFLSTSLLAKIMINVDDLINGNMLSANKYLCFLVDVDILKSLGREIRLMVEEKHIWTRLKFIKLSDFC